MATARKPEVIAALGARGSGKSAWVKQHEKIRTARRLMVWDLMREYGEHAQQSQRLSDTIRTMTAKYWRIAHQPSMATRAAEFDLLCRAVKAAKRCTFVVEELAQVTSPAKAPPAWRELSLLGRHQQGGEVTIIGISQRPASIDKDFLSCCDVIHCGRLANVNDAKAVAPFLNCDWRELMQLPDLAYVEKHAGKPEPTRGTINFSRPGRAAKPA